MSNVSNDAYQAVLQHLSPASRLNMAAINQRFFDVATRWTDVKTIVFDDIDITLAGANFVHKYKHSNFVVPRNDENPEANSSNPTSQQYADAKRTALELCPGVKKLVIQMKLTEQDSQMLAEQRLKLTKLYVSTANLSLATCPPFARLRTLHLVTDSSRELRVFEVVEPKILKAFFPQTLTRICLTGVYLTENLLNHMKDLKHLVCLDMIGCIVDTRVGAKYVPLLEMFENLEELSIPPSLFSFSTKANNQVDFTFRNLKVAKLGVYMDEFDEDLFYSQTLRFLPTKLEVLVLFGNYFPLKNWKQLNSIKNMKILFGPNVAMASCPQPNLTNVKLLSHLVRCPPYVIHEYTPRFHRNHDIAVENMTWKFSLIEWQNDARSQKELQYLRRRMAVADDQEVVFEGIRIPPPVIEQRFGQFRDRMGIRSPADDIIDFVHPFARIPPAPPLLPRRRRALERSARRHRSAPPLPIGSVAPLALAPSASMTTQPPSPPATRTGVVLNQPIPAVSPIVRTTGTLATTTAISTVSRVGGTSDNSSVMNRAFLGTPSETRRLSTSSQNSTVVNSEMTTSPERLRTPPVPTSLTATLQTATSSPLQLAPTPPTPDQTSGSNTSNSNSD